MSRRAIGAFLVVATLAVYAQTLGHDFVNYDDYKFVVDNPTVRTGLSIAGLRESFAVSAFVFPIPLTVLSHMLDCQLYGLNAGGHHLTSVLLHVASALLLFAVLDRMTAAPWRSGFVAAMFALHPLHVESVAWVAERKDVLSTFFAMVTLWAYVRWVERPAPVRYGGVLLALTLGLLAKPMLVTVPFLLLLLDYWPLARLTPPFSAALRARLREKVPLFALALAASVTTLIASRHADTMISLEHTSLGHRIARALVAYVAYMQKTIWPTRLAVFYPDTATASQAVAAAVLLGAITIAIVRSARRRPYLLVGWLWYLGALVPVIGIVQVGLQEIADRYTYVPLVGLFMIVSWGAVDLASRWRVSPVALRATAVTIVVLCAILTWFQVRHWRNGITLFEHALAVTTDNFVAHDNLGEALVKERRLDEAVPHFIEAVRIRPTSVEAHNNLGAALFATGRIDEARAEFAELVRQKPDYARAHNNLGLVLEHQRLLDEAIREYAEAVRLDPTYTRARANLEAARARRSN